MTQLYDAATRSADFPYGLPAWECNGCGKIVVQPHPADGGERTHRPFPDWKQLQGDPNQRGFDWHKTKDFCPSCVAQLQLPPDSPLAKKERLEVALPIFLGMMKDKGTRYPHEIMDLALEQAEMLMKRNNERRLP